MKVPTDSSESIISHQSYKTDNNSEITIASEQSVK